jgi:hypothetical protein
MEPYQILQIQPESIVEPEQLGSKEKFWFEREGKEVSWLFKYPQVNTGQHWAEKIAAEVARVLDIQHARVELAEIEGTRGSATESFARGGRSLVHGNQILAGKVLGYAPEKRHKQSDHTLENIFLALENSVTRPIYALKLKRQFAEYLVLDAIIGNTDRHHENWGILRRKIENKWFSRLAPTFDHASSLGRELLDESGPKCRRSLLEQNTLSAYAERAHGAIYWSSADRKGLSPLKIVGQGSQRWRHIFQPALEKIPQVTRAQLENIVDRVPADWMTHLARLFAVELMCYNLNKVIQIRFSNAK